MFRVIPCTRRTSSAPSMSFAFCTHSLSSRGSVFCFYPSGCPTYENNTSYSLGKELVVEFHAANHQLHSYLLITSLFVWNHSTLGAKSRKSQLPHKWPASLLRWSPLCPSPALSNCWETERELAPLEVLFGYLFMVFPFNIHVFFPALSGCGTKFAASEVAGARNQVSAPVSPVDEGRR